MLVGKLEPFIRLVDNSGGVIIPEEIQDELNIKEGDVFELRTYPTITTKQIFRIECAKCAHSFCTDCV